MRTLALCLAAVLCVAAVPNASAPGIRILHRFSDGADGAFPWGGVAVLNGVLYGTTKEGGSGCGGAAGCGTLFALTTAGDKRVVYNFEGGNDGRSPQGTLHAADGVLYGTTAGGGGPRNLGTVFEVNASTRAERVLHSFGALNDGAVPAGLVAADGAPYGTTALGGEPGCGANILTGSPTGCGTVFRIGKAGDESITYRFKTKEDGVFPSGGLAEIDGKLYGTTNWGGSYVNCKFGCGTVFEVAPSGEKRTLYRFKNRADGAFPSGVLALNGKLYGTTFRGGANALGTVFEVSTAGDERVLYSFKGWADGEGPTSDLIAYNGLLYGSTEDGGGSSICSRGCGTVFEVSTSGQERVLYRFTGESDGANPSRLAELNGALYGTASAGGDPGCRTLPPLPKVGLPSGCGTVFEVRP